MRTFLRRHRGAAVLVVAAIPALFSEGATVSVGSRTWSIAGWMYGAVVVSIGFAYLGWRWRRER